MSELEKSIKRLRSEGKSYKQIQSELNCSKATISYHLGDGQKHKNNRRTAKYRQKNILLTKWYRFTKKQNKVKKDFIKSRSKFRKIIYDRLFKYQKFGVNDMSLNIDDVLKKIEEHPFCYLTGDPVDLNNPKSFHFDHKIPVSRGGNNSLDNLGICTREANMSKTDMTLDEYLELCKKVLEHNGYIVTKAEK